MRVLSFGIPCGPKTFIYMKEFKSIDKQIDLLKNRGLKFKDEKFARNMLLQNNYYNIINGYKDLFIKPHTKDIFLDGTSFEEIFALYNFDKSLKEIYLEYILKIENNIKSMIAYYFSENHGNDNYLKLNNFENFNDIHSVTLEKKQKRIKNIQELISIINKEIAKTIDTKDYMQHYMLNYGFVPLWVVVNILSFGQISKFFELMKQKERILISRHYCIDNNDLVQFIKILAYFRNLCAHDDRIYNAKVPKYLYIPDTFIHQTLGIEKVNGMYNKGKNDLFALTIVLWKLLDLQDSINFYTKLHQNIKKLESELKTIRVEDVLNKMNFPNNWERIISIGNVRCVL